MTLTQIDKHSAEIYETDIPGLVHMTGPLSYDYMFDANRQNFDLFIKAAWRDEANYFGYPQATLALDGQRLIGLEIGHSGADRERLKAGTTNTVLSLAERGAMDPEALGQLVERADKASYLNPYVPTDAYYLLALATPVANRGQRIGALLMENLITRARQAGYREVHLDVLSNNPAVNFYQAHGFVCMAETIAPIPCREHSVPMEMRMVLPL